MTDISAKKAPQASSGAAVSEPLQVRSKAWGLSRVAALVFSSGFCSLVYQTVWFREFRLIFGASTLANAAVLAIFMAGLGIGGLVLGRYADRWRRPLNNYANLEFLIALTAAATPFLLDLIRQFYYGLGGTSVLGGVTATLLRLGLTALVLAPSVFFMGGTLPAAAKAVTDDGDGGRRGLAVLYALNTLGAVTGVVLSTFLLFEISGFRTTLYLAALLNVLVALSARALARELEPQLPPQPSPTAAEPAAPQNPGATPVPHELLAIKPRRWLLPAAFTTGFVFFLTELVWYRLAAPILGGSTYTFGIILALALFGIGVGGYLHALRGERASASVGSFGVTCTLQALLLIAPFALGDVLAYLTLNLHNFGSSSFIWLSWSWVLAASLMVMPAALVAGYQFPLMFALKGRGEAGIGSDTGKIYAANTLGAITGSLLGGFGVFPLLGANKTWILCAALMVALGFYVTARSFQRERGKALLSGLFALAALYLMTSPGPSAFWTQTAIGAGRASFAIGSQNDWRAAVKSVNDYTLEQYDGVESSVGFGISDGLSLINNGKSDGNIFGDAATQVFLGLVPAALHPEPKSAFVIGLGTGQTAGWLAEVPGMARVDVAEIEPNVRRFAELAAATNYDATDRPNVNLIIGDGRESLITSRQGYDVIVSEPSNPYRAGIASFYTEEFYKQAAAHLNPGGYFAQWVQTYEVSPAAVATVVNTMSRTFPALSYWSLSGGDLLLLGSLEPQTHDVAALRNRAALHPFSTALQNIQRVSGAEGLLMMHLANDRVTAPFLQSFSRSNLAINRDDTPTLEYMFARTVGRPFDAAEVKNSLIALGLETGDYLPQVRGGEIDRQQLERFRAMSHPELTEAFRPVQSPATKALATFWQTYYAGDPTKTAALIPTLPRENSAALRYAVAKVRVQQTSTQSPRNAAPEAALEAELDALERTEVRADVTALRLYWALKRGDETQATALIPGVVDTLRSDPWFSQGALLFEGASREPLPKAHQSLAKELLAGPLNGYKLEAQRRTLLLSLAAQSAGTKPVPYCTDVYQTLSDVIPWERAVLGARVRCFEAYGNEALPEAKAALERFDTL